MIRILAVSSKLRQNELTMRRLLLVFILTAICITAMPASAHVVDVNSRNFSDHGISKAVVPVDLSMWIICRNDPINLYDPTGKAANPAGMGDMPQDNLTGDVLWVEAYAPPPYSPDNLTIQVGAFSSGGAISGGNTSSGKIYSSNSDTGWGETGTYVTGGGGSFLGLSYSTGMEISISGNAHPEDVSGEVLELGGSVGIGPGVGVSVSCPLDDFANIILTFSFGYNVGALLEGHAFVNNTTVKVTESHTFHRQEGAE
ncbi:hypothetical protein K8T06_06350 [bacterium]|nr:hypothetical protein [bacterium]